jgi:peptidyl carrier protein
MEKAMKSDMTETEVSERLVAFIKRRFLSDELKRDFNEESPLLELGILDSLNTAILLNFIRDELRTSIPYEKIEAEMFRDVRSVSAVVRELAAP